MGVNLNGLAAVNLRNFGLGLTFNNNFVFETDGSADIKEDDLTIDDEGNVEYTGDNFPKISASNTLIGQGLLSMGTNLTNAPLNLGTISIGANAKYLTANQYVLSMEGEEENGSYEMNADEDPRSANGFGLDAGALVRATDMVNVGVTARNLVTNWGSHEIDELDERLPRTVVVGAAANLPFPIGATVAADLELPDEGDRVYRVGAEKNIILGLLTLRAGAYGTDLSDGDYRTITGGLGLNLPFIDFNLAGDSDSNYSFAGTVSF
ncbi:conjugal transfer protein TraF [Natroniella sp. ANB-PHB2]|uniref:conjugal transfer protein TraF n=1 Tax=Natroniella sp. ANB-PHB2 TaxID=3384444 RepID=UPI0038D465D6